MTPTIQNIRLLSAAAPMLLMLASCHTHYRLASIERSRIVVDSRYDHQPDARAMAFIAPYKHQVDSVMGPVLGTAACNMNADRPESLLGNLLPDIMVWAGAKYGEKPDLGVYNLGGIRSAISKGKVTYGDVLDVAPFENKICFLTLTGARLTELFQQIAHRGGEGLSHGVEIVISADGKLRSAMLHGQPIDPAKSYRIATIDYLAQGNDGMTAFKSGTSVNAPSEESNNSRFIIMDYFRQMQAQGKAVDAKIEGRVKVEQ